MNSRYTHLVMGLLMPLLLSCGTGTTPSVPSVSPITPSPELYQILQQFMAADTLNDYPKVHVAFIRPDTVAGQVSIYLQDEYNSNDVVKLLPLTTWKVDGEIIFVFTGLEAVAAGGDTTYHYLIRATALENRGKIWSPPFRGWRVDVQDQRIIRVNRQLPFISSLSFEHFALPPPPPVLSSP